MKDASIHGIIPLDYRLYYKKGNEQVKAAGRILKFYRELITECIPLFVAAGLIAALCGTASLAGVSCLKAVFLGLYQLVIPVMAGYKAGRKCGGDAGGLAGALAASAVRSRVCFYRIHTGGILFRIYLPEGNGTSGGSHTLRI